VNPQTIKHRIMFGFLSTLLLILVFEPIRAIPSEWQSSINISSPGLLFSPLDQQALFLAGVDVSSLFLCAQQCHCTGPCRIFDYDSHSSRCRLYQGDFTTMGQVISSASPWSRVGWKKILPEQFLSIGQPCSTCPGSRYLRCTNDSWQCHWYTYFDGSICQSQKLLGQPCQNTSECRSDLKYTCLSTMQCGRES
jgi:hypothetical protein